MHVRGKTSLPASPAEVWIALQNPDVLARCIAHCESFERLTPTAYFAVTRVKVGPLRLRIPVSIALEELDPPSSWTIHAHAKSLAGTAEVVTRINLFSSQHGTELSYTAEAALGGKFAALARKWSDAVTRPALARFFSRLTVILNERTAQTPPSGSGEPAPELKPDHETTQETEIKQDTAIPVAPDTPRKSPSSRKAWISIGIAAAIAAVTGAAVLLRRR